MSQPVPESLKILSSPQFWSANKPSAAPNHSHRPAPTLSAAPGGWPSQSRWAAAHRFLAEHAFYPLTFCTLLCFAFWFVRIGYTRTLTYDFLVKNLFLAWVPYFFSLVAVHLHARPPQSAPKL